MSLPVPGIPFLRMQVPIPLIESSRTVHRPLFRVTNTIVTTDQDVTEGGTHEQVHP